MRRPSLLVDLRWPGSANTHTIGAELTLKTSDATMTRDVRSGSGYLSGDPSRSHFGIPAGASTQSLEIRWPDGVVSTLRDVQPNTLLMVTREDTVRLSPDKSALSDSPDSTLRAIIAQQGLTGDPSTGRELPDIEDPLAQLGMKLFFTKALGGDKDFGLCDLSPPVAGRRGWPGAVHRRRRDGARSAWAWQDPSCGYFNVPRNAPTTFNIGLWDQVLFFDGRVESLGKTAGRNGDDGLGIRTPDTRLGIADPNAGDTLVTAQARFPVTSKEEMRGSSFEFHRPNRLVREHLAARLGDYGSGKARAGH